MSEAVKLIVEAFVWLNDRETLEEMREHRQGLRRVLQEKTSGVLDISSSMHLIDDDLSAIEAGLAKL